MELNRMDLQWCLRRLPKSVYALLKDNPGALFLAGGFIRSCVANESVQDIDLFSKSKEQAEAFANKLALQSQSKVYRTDNAFTVRLRACPVQFIHRWSFETPSDCVKSFDFTIARAAIWRGAERWESERHADYYADLAAKRLVYCSPIRNEDAGGSILRVLKFYQRGYRIPLDSMGAVIARLVVSVKPEAWRCHDPEAQLSKVLTGLLREVDPNIDPTHEAHLPSSMDEDVEVGS